MEPNHKGKERDKVKTRSLEELIREKVREAVVHKAVSYKQELNSNTRNVFIADIFSHQRSIL
jgi:hypothetical protein